MVTRYLVLLLCGPLLMYPLPFALLRLPGFDRWSTSYFGRSFEFGFETRGQDADVVIFGDSSALYDIDPVRMSGSLGVKVLNLPSTMATLVTVQDMALRSYLAHNAAPKLIVFYLDAWNMDFLTQRERLLAEPGVRTYDGEEMLVRHGSAAELLEYARLNPYGLAVFPVEFYKVNSLPKGLERIFGPYGPSETEWRGGHHVWDLGLFGPLRQPCRLPGTVLTEAGSTTAKLLTARYQTSHTRVLFFLAPIPHCRGANLLAARSYSGERAAPPKVMAAENFIDDGYLSHLTTAAVPEATDDLTRTLAPLLEPHSGRRQELINDVPRGTFMGERRSKLR
jgi:hypothetical protein